MSVASVGGISIISPRSLPSSASGWTHPRHAVGLAADVARALTGGQRRDEEPGVEPLRLDLGGDPVRPRPQQVGAQRPGRGDAAARRATASGRSAPAGRPPSRRRWCRRRRCRRPGRRAGRRTPRRSRAPRRRPAPERAARRTDSVLRPLGRRRADPRLVGQVLRRAGRPNRRERRTRPPRTPSTPRGAAGRPRGPSAPSRSRTTVAACRGSTGSTSPRVPACATCRPARRTSRTRRPSSGYRRHLRRRARPRPVRPAAAPRHRRRCARAGRRRRTPSPSSSLAPLITPAGRGRSGALATKPTTLTTRSTWSRSPISALIAASALRRTPRASSRRLLGVDLGADLAGREQRRRRRTAAGPRSRPGHRCAPPARTPRPAATTGGQRRGPSSASRSSTALTARPPAGPLQVGDELVAAAGAGHDLDQLPAVGAPLVEDLLRRVDQQRNRRVLPFLSRREPRRRDLNGHRGVANGTRS